MLHIDGLCKTFRSGGKTVEAVKGIDLHLEPGEVLAFLGPNGAGKTTTVKMIAGLIRKDGGTVQVAGSDPEKDARALKQIGAVLEGNRNLYWRLTAHENLEYFGILRGLTGREARRRGTELLARFDLNEKQRTPVRMLSRGMQQKLALAVALIHSPRLLLLDEPTLGLDPEAAEVVKGMIREIVADDRAVLLTTHQMGVAEEIAHRVAIIKDGEILTEATTEELLRRFSGKAYQVFLEDEVDGDRRRRLEALGAWFNNGHVEYMGSPEGLYSVLEILCPLPIIKVEKDQANLNGIFLKLVRGQADA